jgi:hypothetical protein
VDQYSLSWLDFDIEGNALLDYAANDRRNAAIAAMQRNNPFLRISYTLPVETYGLLEDGLKILVSAKNAGVRVDGKFKNLKPSCQSHDDEFRISISVYGRCINMCCKCSKNSACSPWLCQHDCWNNSHDWPE